MSTRERGSRSLIFCTAFISLFVVPISCGTIYGASRDGDFFTLNENTGMVDSYIGVLEYPSTEIVYDCINQKMYSQLPNGAFLMTEIDINTGATIVPPTDTFPVAFVGLEFVPPILYGTGIVVSENGSFVIESALLTVDPVTMNMTFIGEVISGLPVSALAYDVRTDTMYGATGGGRQTNQSSLLLTIDLSTGFGSIVGDTEIFNIGGLAFNDDGILYAGGNNAEGGNIYIIDTVTAVPTLLGPSGLQSVHGLTFVAGSGCQSMDPTGDPTIDPTNDPTGEPSVDPTNDPSVDPTNDPSVDPTLDPTGDPTNDPTGDPSVDPTIDPTSDPSTDPTSDPTRYPSDSPTMIPTSVPTNLGESEDLQFDFEAAMFESDEMNEFDEGQALFVKNGNRNERRGIYVSMIVMVVCMGNIAIFWWVYRTKH